MGKLIALMIILLVLIFYININLNIKTSLKVKNFCKTMKNIQIKIDKEDRTAAFYVSGKLVTLTIPSGWGYFRLGNHKVQTDEAFYAYINASACETDEELNHFIPHFDDNWREKLYWLKNEIENARAVKVSVIRDSVAVVFRNKLNFFIKDKEGFYNICENKLSHSRDVFANLCSAAICETEEELKMMKPMLEIVEPHWENYAILIRKQLQDVILK